MKQNVCVNTLWIRNGGTCQIKIAQLGNRMLDIYVNKSIFSRKANSLT